MNLIYLISTYYFAQKLVLKIFPIIIFILKTEEIFKYKLYIIIDLLITHSFTEIKLFFDIFHFLSVLLQDKCFLISKYLIFREAVREKNGAKNELLVAVLVKYNNFV